MKNDVLLKRNKESKKRHKYKLIHWILVLRDKVRYIHNSLGTMKLGPYGESPYSMFRSWLLDVIQYGLILYVMLFTLGLRLPWYSGIGMGIAYWFVLHEIKEIKKAID